MACQVKTKFTYHIKSVNLWEVTSKQATNNFNFHSSTDAGFGVFHCSSCSRPGRGYTCGFTAATAEDVWAQSAAVFTRQPSLYTTQTQWKNTPRALDSLLSFRNKLSRCLTLSVTTSSAGRAQEEKGKRIRGRGWHSEEKRHSFVRSVKSSNILHLMLSAVSRRQWFTFHPNNILTLVIAVVHRLCLRQFNVSALSSYAVLHPRRGNVMTASTAATSVRVLKRLELNDL